MSTRLPWDFVEPQVCYPTIYTNINYNGERKNRSHSVRNITNEDQLYSLKVLKSLSAVTIEENFSWRKNGGNKIEKPRNQGACGCCWSTSVSSVLGDRYSLKYNIPSLYPSDVWLIANTYKEMGNLPQDACENGGDPITAIIWLSENGTKVEKCWPFYLISEHDYIAPNSLPNNCCITCCDTKYVEPFSNTILKVRPNSLRNLVVTDITGYYINEEATIRLIQNEIKTNGPVVTTFRVYKDFNIYWKYAKGDVYIFDDTPSNYTGGHAVVITGWSTETLDINIGTKIVRKKVRCWEIRNSWGTDSGDDGYCKIAFSTDVQANKVIEIDIPKILVRKTLNTNMICSGGVVTFLPGELPDSAYEILNIEKPVKSTQPPSTPIIVNTYNIGTIIGIFFGVFVGTVIIGIILKKIKSKINSKKNQIFP